MQVSIIFASCQGMGQPAKSSDGLQKALSTLQQDKDLKYASISFYAMDMETGVKVAGLNENMSQSPASTQKIILTATALDVLGSGFQYKTKIEYDSTIKDGVLYGNVYITGGGDPTLGSHFFKSYYGDFISIWAEKLLNAGIREIKGAVIGDDGIYDQNIIPRKRAWEDIANYYGVGGCGLSVFDNSYTIVFGSGPNDGDPTWIKSIRPEIPGLQLANSVKASNDRGDNAFIFGTPYTYDRFIYGTIPKGKDSFEVDGAIPDPALYTAYLLNEKLSNSGIKIHHKPTTSRLLKIEKSWNPGTKKTIHTTSSPSLQEIVRVTNMVSFNSYPEHFLVHLGAKLKGEANSDAGLEAIKTYWGSKGMDTRGFFPFDGCGLTKYNQIAPTHLVFILNYMKKNSKYFDAFYESLPIAGKSGTLSRVCKGTVAEDKIHAKSGSIGKVRAYSGYASTLTGKEIAFSIILSNYDCSDSEARKKLETIMVAIVND